MLFSFTASFIRNLCVGPYCSLIMSWVPVVKLENFIRARGLNHCQFIAFLEETNADHQDLLYHSRVRWLSLGKVLQRVWELKEEICSSLEMMGKSHEFPKLSDRNWFCDFAFAVDIFSYMTELNMKPQGKIRLCMTCTPM